MEPYYSYVLKEYIYNVSLKASKYWSDHINNAILQHPKVERAQVFFNRLWLCKV